mmetsp:Transcript_36723/g.95389  ORF Transcript_36723/g.95389 Transcript_36723/m.95389 type:complete len:395 (+) Transcript_36723:109-1293(+)
MTVPHVTPAAAGPGGASLRVDALAQAARQLVAHLVAELKVLAGLGAGAGSRWLQNLSQLPAQQRPPPAARLPLPVFSPKPGVPQRLPGGDALVRAGVQERRQQRLRRLAQQRQRLVVQLAPVRQDLREEGRRVAACEGQLPRQQAVHHHAGRPLVHLRPIHRLQRVCAHQLRREVLRRPAGGVHPGALAQVGGEAEVDEIQAVQVARALEHEVGGLDVVVRDAQTMQDVDAVQQAAHQCLGVLLATDVPRRQQLLQIAALHCVHHDVQLVAGVEAGVHARHRPARVLGALNPPVQRELQLRGRILRVRVRLDALHDYHLAGLAVDCAAHHREGAAPQLLLQRVLELHAAAIAPAIHLRRVSHISGGGRGSTFLRLCCRHRRALVGNGTNEGSTG